MPALQKPWRLVLAGTAVACVTVLAYVLTRPISPPHVSGYVQITHDGKAKLGVTFTSGGPPAALATDGARLYFTEGSANALVLAQVSTAGGDTAVLPTPFAFPQLLDISPRRPELLVGGFVDPGSAAPLWVLPVPAGTPRRLGGVLAWDAT
jgi:hypothetical protein